MTWRRLPFLVLPGAENMALDAWLLGRTLAGAGPHLRFYLWARPTLSLGRSQDAAAVVDRPFCEANGIDVVRRPTGGRAVLHHMELTYGVTGLFGKDGFPKGVQETYKAICEALCEGLAALGVGARLWDGAASALPSPKSPLPCFATPAPGEVVLEGKKMIGSAMAVEGPGFLQHGSILIAVDAPLQLGAQREKARYPVAGVADALRPLPPWSAVLRALEGGFARRFAAGAMELVEPSEEEWAEVRGGTGRFRVAFD
jgi:lipoate-protein ligase A